MTSHAMSTPATVTIDPRTRLTADAMLARWIGQIVVVRTRNRDDEIGTLDAVGEDALLLTVWDGSPAVFPRAAVMHVRLLAKGTVGKAP